MALKTFGRKAFRAFCYLIILLNLILAVYPLLWLVTTSMKTYSESITWPPSFLPASPTLQSYVHNFKLDGFLRSFFNSAVFTCVGTFFTVLVSTLAAYGFSRYHFPLKKLLFFVVLITLMIPNQITLVPVFLTLTKLRWINTFQGLIVPGIASGFGIFLVNQFAADLPDDYFEAARIDGAKEMGLYVRIFLPLCKPIIATLVVLEFIGRWNDLFWPLIVTNSTDMTTLTLLLTTANRSVYDTYWNDLSAAMVIALVPILLIYVSFQKYFIKGIALSSGIKG